MSMDSDRNKRECKKHEKRSNDMQRVCETCGRHYFLCDICRPAKNIEAPDSICQKCTPAYKTLRNILDKKDVEIFDLQTKLKRIDSDVRTNDDLKKQISNLKRNNDDLKFQLKIIQEECDNLKKSNEKLQFKCDKMTDDFKSKYEFIRDIKSLLKTCDYADFCINVNDEKYLAHKCIVAARSQVLRDLIEASLNKDPTPSPPPPQPPQPKPKQETNGKSKSKKEQKQTRNSIESVNLPPVSKPEVRKNKINQNSIILNQVDPAIMPFVINYIYSGETEHINDKNVQSVMKAADILELNGLRTSCLVFMESRLNRSTCIPILIEAYELNHERLKRKCLNYMHEENIDLTSSSQWVEFKNENPKLALNLYERYIKEVNALSSQQKQRQTATTETSEKGNSTSRSNDKMHLKPLKNPIPAQHWNTSSNGTIFSNKASNGGSRKIVVDR